MARSIVTLLCAAASLLVVLVLTVPGDLRKYRTTFERNGLWGFVQMRSAIAVQIWLPVTSAIVIPIGLCEARRRQLPAAYQVLSLAKLWAIIGFIGYAFAMGSIVNADINEFVIGAVGFLLLFVLLPSVLLLIGAMLFTMMGYVVLVGDPWLTTPRERR